MVTGAPGDALELDGQSSATAWVASVLALSTTVMVEASGKRLVRKSSSTRRHPGTANSMNEFVAQRSFNDPDQGLFTAPPV